jgi:hypothetical protein
MRRREFLAVTGLSATVSTAGCLDTVFGRDIRLARFSVSNYDEEAHRFDLRVDRDGEVVHRSSHEVRARDEVIYGETPECDWEGTPGAYEVSARADGGEWESRPLAEVRDGRRDSVSCASAYVSYGPPVGIRFRPDCEELSAVSPENCLPEGESDES